MIMKVKVYIDWQNRLVLSETEFNEMISNRIKEKIENNYELDYYLENENPYSHSEIFFLTDTEKKELYKKFQDYCREEVKKEVIDNEDWSEDLIEI